MVRGGTYAEPRKLSKGHINAQYRRLNRFFNWLVERGPNDENPMLSVSAPNMEEKTVPVITEDQMRDLLPLAAPVLARTPSPSLSPGLRESTAVLVLGHARTACRDRKVATCGRGPNQWHAAGHRQGPERTEDAEGDTARSVMLDYLQEREVLMPRTKALRVSEQGDALLPNGICQVPKRLAKRAGIEDIDPPPLPPSHAINALRAGMPEQVLKIVGGLEKDTRDLLPKAGGGGGQGVSPAGDPGDRLGRATSGRGKRKRGQQRQRGRM